MKKNLISVLILALVFANFVLTAILMFTVLPETQKANTLIEKVCSAIDLENLMLSFYSLSFRWLIIS